MILSATINEKSFGSKVLYKDLYLSVEDGEKVGLIGRNGTGKSTLVHIITGDDTDYDGSVVVKQGSIVVSSRQEHHGYEETSVLDYIQSDLPEYATLEEIIRTYPDTMGDDTRKIQTFTDALQRFDDLGYFQITDDLQQALELYQIDADRLQSLLKDLSGGQRRTIELMKVQRSRGHIALIDEPTNHMDYVAKDAFVKWMQSAQEAILVITHDRDVLRMVDRIVEIKDGAAYSFRGNYDDYLKSNTTSVTSQMNEYDITQKRIRNLQEDVIRFQRLKERSRDPGTIKRFKSQEQQARAELVRLQQLEKPSFWIDQDSASTMTDKLTASYDKYKAQNIRIRTVRSTSNTSRLLIQAKDLSLGYAEPLFTNVSFALHEGERLRLHGRNGAGKTTIISAIMAQAVGGPSISRKYQGTLVTERELRIGYYQQEINPEFLQLTLHDALEQVLRGKDVDASEQRIKQLLSDYLFNPATDGDSPLSRLSGGQKARFQLISMLAGDPDVLILDEPTNHLDLPSIEELEQALGQYSGALIYISHDSYFAKKLGGQTVAIGN